MKKLIKKYLWGNIMVPPVPGTTPSNSDLMGNINYYNYLQSLIPIIKQKDAEKKVAEARKAEERRRGTIGPDRNPKTYKERENDARRNEFNYMIQTNPYHQWVSDPNGTGSMLAAVEIMPLVIKTTLNYFNRPVGEILKGEARALNHVFNPLMVTDDAFLRSKDYMHHGLPILGMLSGFGGFGLGTLSAFPFATPVKSGIGYTVNAGRKLGRQVASDYINWVNSNISQGLRLGSDLGFTPQFQVAGTNFNLRATPELTFGRFNTMNSTGQNFWNTLRGKNKTAENVAPGLEAPTGNEASLGKLAPISNKNGNVPVYTKSPTKKHFLLDEEISDPSLVTKENVSYITDNGNVIYNPDLVTREMPGKPSETYWVDNSGNRYNTLNTEVKGKKNKKYIIGEGDKHIGVKQKTFPEEKPRTIYEYNGREVTPETTTAYKYNGKYYPEAPIEKEIPGKTQLNVGDDLPRDAIYYDFESSSFLPINGAIFRRPEGRAWNRWTYANGLTPKGFKNPWILHTTIASPFITGLVVGRKPIFNFIGNRAYSIGQGTGLFGPGRPKETPVNNNSSTENTDNGSTSTTDTTTTTLPVIDTAAQNLQANELFKEFGY